jgi:hypothetical protein
MMICLSCAASLPLLSRAALSMTVAPPLERARALRALVIDRVRARRLGQRYLAQVPLEREPAVLARLIDAALKDRAAAGIANRARLADALEAQIRAEFGAGQIVRVDGWVLARTEARLCALCA